MVRRHHLTRTIVCALILVQLVIPCAAAAEQATPLTCRFWQLSVPGCFGEWQDLWGGIIGSAFTLIAALIGAGYLVRTTSWQIRQIQNQEDRAEHRKAERLLGALAEQTTLVKNELEGKSKVLSLFLDNIASIRSDLSHDARALLFDPALPVVANEFASLVKTEGLADACEGLRLSREELTLLFLLPRGSRARLLHQIDQLVKLVAQLEAKLRALSRTPPSTPVADLTSEFDSIKTYFAVALSVAAEVWSECDGTAKALSTQAV